MQFGKRRAARLERGVQRSSRRQLAACMTGLVILTVLGWRLGKVGERPPRAVAAPAEASLPDPLPAAFVERPDILERAASSDRTSSINVEMLKLLLHKARIKSGSPDAPALTVGRDESAFDALLGDPGRWRGKLVELKGKLVSESSDIKEAHHFHVLGTDNNLYKVATARKRSDIELMDGVSIRAYYSQLYTGQVVHEGETRNATIPFLVGETLELLPRRVVEQPSGLYLPLAGALGLSACIAIWILSRGSLSSYESRRKSAKAACERTRRRGVGADGEGTTS